MEARMRSLVGWMRRRLGGIGTSPARARKRQGRVPSVCESLELRQVLSSATFSPFAAMPGPVTPIATTMPVAQATTAIPTAIYEAASVPAAVVSPTSIGVSSATATPAYYYGQSVVQAPVATQASSVAPVYYAGQPVVAASAAGISSTNQDTDYVQALYRTVLDRVGHPDEVAAWVARMQTGTTIPEVAEGFVNSPEHRQDEVDSYYEEFLHRTPDSLAAGWVEDLLNGASEESVAEAILDSPEYQTAHQAPGALVQGLYQDILGRTPDAAGYADWNSALGSGVSPQEVIAGFVGSPEAIDQVIENYYEGYLHRQPDLPTSAAWAQVLESPNGSASDLAVSLLSSAEFVQDSQQA